MKKTDIAALVLIAITSVLIAFFVGRSIFGQSYVGNTKVKVIDSINSSIAEPDSNIFNSNAINPAIQVQIDENGAKTSTTNS
jgi:hypothetical protein